MSSENMLQTDIIVAQENSPTNSKKRKAGSQYTHDDVPAILVNLIMLLICLFLFQVICML